MSAKKPQGGYNEIYAKTRGPIEVCMCDFTQIAARSESETVRYARSSLELPIWVERDRRGSKEAANEIHNDLRLKLELFKLRFRKVREVGE